MSVFATPRNLGEEGEAPLPEFDEKKMEQALERLALDAERMDGDDPREAALLMRKLTDMTGMRPGPGMEEVLRRMEAGEDPDEVEAEMGDILEEEDPFVPSKKSSGRGLKTPPKVDEKLYFL